MSLDVLVPVWLPLALGSMAGVPGQGWAWPPGARRALAGGWSQELGAGLRCSCSEAPLPPKHPQPRVGMGLLPFFLACAVYLLVRNADQPPWVNVLLKILPVLYLAGFLGTAHPGGGYRALLQRALLCSAVGDACLVWPEALRYGESA